MTPAARAAAYVEAHLDEDVPLARLADAAGVSPAHLQRAFTREFGHSPKQHAAALRAEALKARLREAGSVSDAGYEAGFGSSRGVYEASQRRLGMPPGAYRRGGAGVRIGWSVAPSPLGAVLVGVTDAGVAAVMLGEDEAGLASALASEFPAAQLERDDAAAGAQARAVAAYVAGRGDLPDTALDLRGTDFQRAVWTALRQVPAGTTVTYAEVAARIGAPSAHRAVANACGGNHVALLVPCHRVVRTDGGLGGYKWGVERKRALLEMERQAPASPAGAPCASASPGIPPRSPRAQ